MERDGAFTESCETLENLSISLRLCKKLAGA